MWPSQNILTLVLKFLFTTASVLKDVKIQSRWKGWMPVPRLLSAILFRFQKFTGYCVEWAERLRDTIRNIPFNTDSFYKEIIGTGKSFFRSTYCTMNNLLSYCGLIDAKIRASDKDLPAHYIHMLAIGQRNLFILISVVIS